MTFILIRRFVWRVSTWTRNGSRSTWLVLGTQPETSSKLSRPRPTFFFFWLVHVESIQFRDEGDTVPDLRRLTSWGWKHMRETQTTTHREEAWAMGSERQDGGMFGETESHD